MKRETSYIDSIRHWSVWTFCIEASSSPTDRTRLFRIVVWWASVRFMDEISDSKRSLEVLKSAMDRWWSETYRHRPNSQRSTSRNRCKHR